MLAIEDAAAELYQPRTQSVVELACLFLYVAVSRFDEREAGSKQRLGLGFRNGSGVLAACGGMRQG